MQNSTKFSQLDTNDIINIQTALKYTANDMFSQFFRDKFLDTLLKIIGMEGEEDKCIVKE